MQGDQIVVLTVLDLVSVAPRCHGHRACRSLVDRKWQPRNRTKNSLGRLAGKDHHPAVTRSMIVHRRSLAWTPTKDQYLSVRQVDYQVPFVGVRVEPDEGLRIGEDLAMIDLRKKFGHRLGAQRCPLRMSSQSVAKFRRETSEFFMDISPNQRACSAAWPATKHLGGRSSERDALPIPHSER